MNAKKYADSMKIKDKRLPFTLYVQYDLNMHPLKGGGES